MAWVCALINPLALATVVPLAGYFIGTAALGFHGLPGISSFNLDRETFLPRRGGGCVFSGGEWLSDGWGNQVLRTCVSVFGPMRGSPSSSYPSDGELIGAWQSPEELSPADLQKGSFSIGGVARDVPADERLLENFAPWAASEIDEPATRILAKDFGGSAFAIRIAAPADGFREGEMTILFGDSPARIIGYFPSKEARSWRRFPPVQPGAKE